MKYAGLIALCVFLFWLLFPRKIPRFFRRLGRSVGDVGRVTKEIATGEEAESSPLARYEVSAGETVAAKVLSEHTVSRDEELQGLVSAVGSRLAAHALRTKIPYRFQALESNDPKALAIPGGWVFITRPLVDLCERLPDRIAGVLAHEIIHIDRRHVLKKTVASLAIRTGLRALGPAKGAILSRLTGGMEDAISRGLSQEDELEADLYGTRLAQLAGFDPTGLISVLETLAAPRPGSGRPLAEILPYASAHPPVQLRLERLSKEWR